MIAEAVHHFFVKHGIAPCRLAVAVSGGADSTALLIALHELQTFDLVCAHVNHHLRGSESDGDEAFVRELCARFDIPLHVADGTLDDDATRARGVEAAAREVRYARLRQLRDDTQARYVATAHQRNDQAETVLMRLITGGGIAALRGVHPVRDDGFVRPLLDVTRDAIDAYLRSRDIAPRFDRSNDDPRFLRNRVRVVLRELGGIDNLAALATEAQRVWPHLERAIDAEEHAEVDEDETRFTRWPDDVWLRRALLHRHIRRLDPHARDVSASDLERLATSTDKRISVTKHVELVRRNDAIVLRRHPAPTPPFEIRFEHDAFIEPLGLTMRVAPASHGDRQRFQLPPGAARAFTVRNRRRGDVFHPLGLGGSKKLKDFLIDRKIAAEVRDRIPLLLWNDEIVWIAGVEVSERFKVTARPGERYEVWLEGSGGNEHHGGLQRRGDRPPGSDPRDGDPE